MRPCHESQDALNVIRMPISGSMLRDCSALHEQPAVRSPMVCALPLPLIEGRFYDGARCRLSALLPVSAVGGRRAVIWTRLPSLTVMRRMSLGSHHLLSEDSAPTFRRRRSSRGAASAASWRVMSNSSME